MSMIIRGDYKGDLPSIVKILNEWRFYPNYHYHRDESRLDPAGYPLEFWTEDKSIGVRGWAETAFPFMMWMNFSDGTRVTTRAATVEQLDREDWEQQIVDVSLDEIRMKIAPHLRSGELEPLARLDQNRRCDLGKSMG